MPYKKPRKVTRPYCKKCGRFLVGGKEGYCPGKHEFLNDKEHVEYLEEMLLTYPSTSTYPKVHEFRQEIIDEIRSIKNGTNS